MVSESLMECSFLLPVRRDPILSDDREHEPWLWDWLEDELANRFGGLTCAPGVYRGSYTDLDTRQRVADESVEPSEHDSK